MPRRVRRSSRPRVHPADPPVARLGSPNEIVAAVPLLCGFVPTESLVVLSLRGPRKRIGLTMRFDLDWCDATGHAAQEIADRLVHDGAAAGVLVLYSGAPDDLVDGAGPVATRARAGLVDQVRTSCLEAGVDVMEALLVRAETWISYLCTGRSCCPDDGTPVRVESSAAVQLLRADAALRGRGVLPSREDLVHSVAAPQLLAAAVAHQHLDRAAEDWALRHRREGRRAVQDHDLEVAWAALDRALTPQGVGPVEAAVLAVAVADLQVRDEIATWVLTRPDELIAALQQAVRQVAPPDDAGLCALLGWVAYAGGDGGLANVALARALESEPGHPLATLLCDALHRQLDPSELRRVLEQTRRDGGHGCRDEVS